MTQSEPPLSAPISCTDKLKALAEPTRLAAVETLMDGGLHVHELCELLGVEQSLLSHHLKVLREVGIVRAVREGRAVRYEVAAGDGAGLAPQNPSTSSPRLGPSHLARSRLMDSDRLLDLGCCRITFDAKGDEGAKR